MTNFLRRLIVNIEIATVLIVLWFFLKELVPSHIIIHLYEKWDDLKPPDLPCAISPPPACPSPAPTRPLPGEPKPPLVLPIRKEHDLNKIADRLGLENCARLIPIILSGQKSKSDGTGFIYIFRKQGERDATKFKIGCTNEKVGVKRRTQQWMRSCNHSVVLLGSWKVKRHRLCERLIHYELKGKNKWLGTVDCNCRNKRGHCEWFSGTLPELKEVIRFWVDYTDRMYSIKKDKFSQTLSAAAPAPK